MALAPGAGALAAGGGGAGAVRAALPRREKATSSINCKDFDSTAHDFDSWIKKFEKSVKLATNVRDDNIDELHYLYKEWLPLKLDEVASGHLDRIDDGAEWNEIKDQLSNDLVDPQEKLRWRARQLTIKWDGKESIHTLASRVIRAVDKFDRHMPQDMKDMEYFTRFRSAFKKPLMRVIDMSCDEGNQTIDIAKSAIMRYQLASAEDDTADAGEPYKAVAFASAQMHPDRATSLENSMAAVATQMENMALSMRSMDDRHKGFEDRLRSLENRSGGSGGYSYGRRDDGYGQRRQGSFRPREGWEGRGSGYRSPSPRAY